MKQPFETFIERSGAVVLDGGLATELERRGADLNHRLWSAKVLVKQPDLVRDVHLDDFRAGADVATTASYQASERGLREAGYSSAESRDIVQSSVRLAQEARERFVEERDAVDHTPPLIAGSAGCYGAYLADGSEYRGRCGLTHDELMEFHRPRVEWLIGAGADLLAFETLPSLGEAEAVAALLCDFPETQAWVTFSCRDDRHVSEGQTVEECAIAAAEAPNVVAIGANCTAPRHIAGLIPRFAAATDRLVIVYPNRGDGWDARKRTWLACEEPVSFADLARTWCDLGARFIGGCCRTTPEDIRAMAESLGKPSE